MTFKIFTCRQTIQAASCSGEKAKDIDNRRDFIIERTMQRFATITGLQFGKNLTIFFDNISQFQQTFRTHFRRGLPPFGKCCICRAHSSIDLLCGCLGNLQ